MDLCKYYNPHIANLIFSNLYGDTNLSNTSGLVDYIVNYVLLNSTITNNAYKEELICQILPEIKLCYTDKDKLDLFR